MTRSRGRDDTARRRRDHGRTRLRPRGVYVFTEGEVTEPMYIDLVLQHGVPAFPDRPVEIHYPDEHAPSKRRKPLPLVEAAIPVLREVERDAKKAGLKKDDWNWPQVWCLFDRDEHDQIPTAFARARQAGVRIGYSHPCFELWRLLHYQNYTSTFSGVCGSAAAKLRQRPGFAQTYSRSVRSVSEEQAKHVMPGQLVERYEKARGYAQQLNAEHHGPDQTAWDPYTDVWRFVEEAVGIAGY
ncbi:RloB family protein [Streptomyces sp. S07_1.15]|uniref:RloB family protein n=1 Tax=Streptomyces sp. S07_1.15 TaxID=2873925 RepID=UPI001D13D48D|nr:RloB family protein [Streptomyces sp. S07_1.15]MCC3652197.1 RloB family protein [Streptomyces sp. S07_1.15]